MSKTRDAVRELADLVYEMRQAQKAYFRLRDGHTLSAARNLEKQVDRALLRIREGSVEQGDLFQGGEA